MALPDMFNKAVQSYRSSSFVYLYFQHGININEPQDHHWPGPLADSLNDKEMTKWLLDHGAEA